MILIDGDKATRAKDFANIVYALGENYVIVGCFSPIDKTEPFEQKVFSHNTEQELADLIRTYGKDHHIAYIVFHKRFTGEPIRKLD